MLKIAELWGIPMGPNGLPNAKETAEIAPELAILENRAFVSSPLRWSKKRQSRSRVFFS
jgi:hypothetical protein